MGRGGAGGGFSAKSEKGWRERLEGGTKQTLKSHLIFLIKAQ